MTRSNAREIAVHLSFALGFSDQTAEELLEDSLSRENFAQLKDEEPLYGEYPNEKQRQYITALVKGYTTTAPNWTAISQSMPSAGPSPVFPA